LKDELGAGSSSDLTHTIQRQLERLKQIACISKQVSLTGTPKRFSRALRSTALTQVENGNLVGNERMLYQANHQQSKTYSSKLEQKGSGRGRSAGWDSSFAQVSQRDYVRNVRNCKLLRQPGASVSLSTSHAYPQHSQSALQSVEQLRWAGGNGQQIWNGLPRQQPKAQAPAPTEMPSAAQILRQLKHEQGHRHLAKDATTHAEKAPISNSAKHSAACEGHTHGSRAANERVRHKHRTSDCKTTQVTSKQAGSASEYSSHQAGVQMNRTGLLSRNDQW
jgi:hypothetical protein